jgi:subtilisin family serine protease
LQTFWNLDRLDNRRRTKLDGLYFAEADGSGVTVYILDTGVFVAHPEFGGRAVFGIDIAGGSNSDPHGHGTHVSLVVCLVLWIAWLLACCRAVVWLWLVSHVRDVAKRRATQYA